MLLSVLLYIIPGRVLNACESDLRTHHYFVVVLSVFLAVSLGRMTSFQSLLLAVFVVALAAAVGEAIV